MERARFNAHHLNVLGKIYLLPSYTGPVGFGSRAAVAPAAATPEDSQEPALRPAAGSTTCHEEDLEEDLDEEQAGEDEEAAVFGAVFSVLNMSFDIQHSKEE
jgi:hypothetical protein